MKLSVVMALVVSGVCLAAGSAYGQLAAFPGAEGAAGNVTGGRGGDVYKVTNLNNSGEGSLRYGIQNAPETGRTIVFGVAGTIELASSLDFNGKSNITIAGQTAPAGGITIANHRMRINDADNVVVQFLRVRPGNTFGSQDPDAIWVQTSTDVMLDHITASWSVDETISTTHNSNNVTVQWSTISQGLYNGGHSEGSGHSYGSLINGGNYTYHHNLYAHNKSRNPRPQASGNYLSLDFVNNVVFNPQDRFGYSDGNDPYDINLVGNYGIKGPDSSSNNALMRPDDLDSKFYVEGNYTDVDKDGLINGNAVNGTAVFAAADEYTLVGSRFTANPMINTHSATEAYIQVLSRAGAVNYRDPVDRRLIRSIMNQLDGSISTQVDWGGWPTLPTGSAAPDSNDDGVPDNWAIQQGFDTATPLQSTYAPSGYSYLEEYIHSLTPGAYAPTGTQMHTISTAFGGGGDAQVNENGGSSSGNGTGSSLTAQWSGSGGSTNQALLLRFDLSEIDPGSVASAALELTTSSSITGSHQFKVYGIEHDATGFDWDESTVEFNNAPGLDFDGNSGTLGIDPEYIFFDASDIPDVLTLGTFEIASTGADQVVDFDNPNLAVFLNLAAYFEGEASEDLVTIVIEQINNASGASFYSQEGSALFAPRLVLDAVLSEVELSTGDYNGDGMVNSADYTTWLDALGKAVPEGTGADGNGDGIVNWADYGIWKTAIGAGSGAGSGLEPITVPEPASSLLVMLGLLALASRRGSRAHR